MARFILIFQDTIDGGIDASFDTEGWEAGQEKTGAIYAGFGMIEAVKNEWSYKKEVTTNESKESEANAKAGKATAKANES